MFNPFEEEFSDHSQEPTELPYSLEGLTHPSNDARASPISFLHLDSLP